MEKCPYECELKYWRSEVISSEVEEKVSLFTVVNICSNNLILKVASLFGAEKKDISIIEFNHSNNKFVTTLFYESGFIVLVNRLGKEDITKNELSLALYCCRYSHRVVGADHDYNYNHQKTLQSKEESQD